MTGSGRAYATDIRGYRARRRFPRRAIDTSQQRAFLVSLTLNYLTVGYAVTQDHDLGMLDGINFDNA